MCTQSTQSHLDVMNASTTKDSDLRLLNQQAKNYLKATLNALQANQSGPFEYTNDIRDFLFARRYAASIIAHNKSLKNSTEDFIALSNEFNEGVSVYMKVTIDVVRKGSEKEIFDVINSAKNTAL